MKWEYTVISPVKSNWLFLEDLNDLGDQGWELVTIQDNTAFFKRPVKVINALGDEKEASKIEEVDLKEGYWKG